MIKEFMFNKSLVEDEPTEIGSKFLDELISHINTQLGGLKALYFSSYRYEGVECFSVDLDGLNDKTYSLNLGITSRNQWHIYSYTAEIDVTDGIDILGLIQYLIVHFQLYSITVNKNKGVLIYSNKAIVAIS